MNIKNYTSTVPANRSISIIEELLVAAGATNINRSYVEGKIQAFLFQIPTTTGLLTFKLPSKVDAVFGKMWEQTKTRTEANRQKIQAQAERTAWKLLHEWVHIQVNLIQLEQVQLLEVFMPYAYDHKSGQTYFEKVISGEVKLLNQ